MFQRALGTDSVFIPYMDGPANMQAISELSENEKKKIKAVCAHMCYGAHKFFKKYQYVTLIREPVERVISSYYFSLSNPNDFGNKLIKEQELSLKEFARRPELYNLQTRYLSSFPFSCKDWHIKPPEDINYKIEVMRIKKRLEKEFIFGLVEDMQGFIKMISNKLNIDLNTNVNSNKTVYRPEINEIDKETIKEIKKNNEHDIELYQFVQNYINKKANSP